MSDDAAPTPRRPTGIFRQRLTPRMVILPLVVLTVALVLDAHLKQQKAEGAQQAVTVVQAFAAAAIRGDEGRVDHRLRSPADVSMLGLAADAVRASAGRSGVTEVDARPSDETGGTSGGTHSIALHPRRTDPGPPTEPIMTFRVTVGSGGVVLVGWWQPSADPG